MSMCLLSDSGLSGACVSSAKLVLNSLVANRVVFHLSSFTSDLPPPPFAYKERQVLVCHFQFCLIKKNQVYLIKKRKEEELRSGLFLSVSVNAKNDLASLDLLTRHTDRDKKGVRILRDTRGLCTRSMGMSPVSLSNSATLKIP